MSIETRTFSPSEDLQIFDKLKFAQTVRVARDSLGITQIQLAEKASLQVNTVRQVEAAAAGSGIMTCLAIARALDLSLPEARLDPEVEKFVADLVLNPGAAAAKFDELFHRWARVSWPKTKMGRSREDEIRRPKNLLWLTGVERRRSFLFSITFKGVLPRCGTEDGLLEWKDILPVELALFLERVTSDSKKTYPESKYPSIAPFWKHVVTGRSDNIGVSRLASALHQTQPALDDWEGGKYKGASLKQLALHAFNNYFELKLLMERAARENEVELTADYPVFLASYLRFHNFAWQKERFSGVLDGIGDNSESPG